MNKPHECPWCSSCDAHIQKSSCALPVFFWVNCKTCGASSPYMKDYQDAVERWNDFSASTRANEKTDDEGENVDASHYKELWLDQTVKLGHWMNVFNASQREVEELKLQLSHACKELEEVKHPNKWRDPSNYNDWWFSKEELWRKLRTTEEERDEARREAEELKGKLIQAEGSLRVHCINEEGLGKELAEAHNVIRQAGHAYDTSELAFDAARKMYQILKESPALSPIAGEAKNEAGDIGCASPGTMPPPYLGKKPENEAQAKEAPIVEEWKCGDCGKWNGNDVVECPCNEKWIKAQAKEANVGGEKPATPSTNDILQEYVNLQNILSKLEQENSSLLARLEKAERSAIDYCNSLKRKMEEIRLLVARLEKAEYRIVGMQMLVDNQIPWIAELRLPENATNENVARIMDALKLVSCEILCINFTKRLIEAEKVVEATREAYANGSNGRHVCGNSGHWILTDDQKDKVKQSLEAYDKAKEGK